jgi:Tfp pilus assembly protein PilO
MTARRVKFDIRQAGRRISIVLALLAVANLLAYFLLVRPEVRDYTALNEGTAPQQRALAARAAEVEEAESYLEQLQQAERDLRTLRDEVLATREERMVEVQLELNELAGKFSIDVDTITFSNDLLQDEGLDKLAMVVPLEGGYANLRKFLQAVEGSSKFLVVERVALGEGKRGGVLLELSITLATYFDAPKATRSRRGVTAAARRAVPAGSG